MQLTGAEIVVRCLEAEGVDRTRLYAVTIYGSPRRVAKLEDQIAPTLRVASHTGMPLVPQSSRLQPTYPASVARTASASRPPTHDISGNRTRTWARSSSATW